MAICDCLLMPATQFSFTTALSFAVDIVHYITNRIQI